MSSVPPLVPTPSQVRVVGVNQLAEGETQIFDFVRGTRTEQGFVVRHGGELFAFVNLCPHWSVDLDMGTGTFYDQDLKKLFCINHGALFEANTGLCVAGPCVGQTLEQLPLRLQGDDAWVETRSLEIKFLQP